MLFVITNECKDTILFCQNHDFHKIKKIFKIIFFTARFAKLNLKSLNYFNPANHENLTKIVVQTKKKTKNHAVENQYFTL